MAEFKSENNDVPEIDLRRLEHIAALITTFEQKDLKTNGVISFHYDKRNDYIFLEVTADVNNKRVADHIMGFDREKVVNLCKNVISFFENNK